MPWPKDTPSRTNTPAHKKWRLLVLQRDHHQCQLQYPNRCIGDNPDGILARQSPETQQRIAEWFGHDSELAGYDVDVVKELGKHVV